MLGVEAETLHDGDAEAEGLTGSGLRLADDVLARKAEGDGLLLDGNASTMPFAASASTMS